MTSFTWRGVEMRPISPASYVASRGRFTYNVRVVDEYWHATIAGRKRTVQNVAETHFASSADADSPSAALDAAARNLEELVRGMPKGDANDG